MTKAYLLALAPLLLAAAPVPPHAIAADVKADSLRASAGLGLSWISPVGPLKLSYGTPIRKEPGDRIQRLQFQIGTAF